MHSLARKLWQARSDGGIVDPASIREPQSDEEAYAVQDEIVRLSAQAVCGFKVGSTSAEAQKLLGTSEPGSCPVLNDFVLTSPARITLVAKHMPALEGEFALRLGRDLPARDAPYEEREVRDAIDAVAGAIEVVGSRLKGGLAGKGRLLVTADSGANIALVVGAWCKDWQQLDLKKQTAAMYVNGELKGHGTGSRALGDPVAVLVWLANQQSRRGRGLKQGEVVSTGTCTGLDPVHSGDTVTADFATLGKVSIDFD